MRLFFAVTVPPEVTVGIVTESKKIPAHSLRWVAPENQHFTLRFLGVVEEGRVAELISTGQETALKHHSFSLTISGAGFFPDEKRPRVFWVGTGAGSEKLIALDDDLSSALDKTGFPTEDRSFLPHLTVARIKEGMSFGSLPFQELKSWKNRNFGSFSVNEFCLMESLLLPVWTRSDRPTGAVYRKVHSFSLEVLDGE